MRLMDRAAFDRLAELGAKVRDSVAACFKDAGIPGSVTGVGSLFRVHPSDRARVDYRSSRHDTAEASRLDRIVRFLLDHGVLISTTGLGCLSTPIGDAEVEGFLAVMAAALRAERERGA
jgi:glutamate-1-semialdehyde 2,1-aminomutase